MTVDELIRKLSRFRGDRTIRLYVNGEISGDGLAGGISRVVVEPDTVWIESDGDN